MAICFDLTPDQLEMQRVARELAQDFATRAADHDRDRSAPIENYAKLREAGFYRLLIPTAYGGLGHSLMSWMVAAQELGQGCASTALSFNMHTIITGMCFGPHVAEEMQQRLGDLIAGQGKLFCGVVSESSTSAHVATSFAPSLIARRVEEGYRLYGQKSFCTMWEAADYAIIAAHDDEGSAAGSDIWLLLDTQSLGTAVHDEWHTLGMRATRSQRVTFDGAFVPEENVVFRTDKLLEEFLVRDAAWSFGCYTAVYLGLGQGILRVAQELLTSRTTKGYSQVLGYHPDLRQRVTEMVCALEAAQLALYKATWLYETQPKSPEVLPAFLKAKYLVGEAVQKAANEATKACGGHALFAKYPLERMIRDAATAPVQPPNADICLSLIGLLHLGLNPDEAMPPLRPSDGAGARGAAAAAALPVNED